MGNRNNSLNFLIERGFFCRTQGERWMSFSKAMWFFARYVLCARKYSADLFGLNTWE